MFGVADSPVATIPQSRSHITLSHTEPRPSTSNLQPLAPHSFKPQLFAQISYRAPGTHYFNIYLHLSFTTREHLLLFESSHACVGTRADSETSASPTLRLIILTLSYVTVLELPEYPLHIQLQSRMGKMLRGHTRIPMRVLGHLTCLPDDPIGVDNTSGFDFDPGSKRKAGKDFGNQSFATQNVPGQPSMEDSSPELELSCGALPWLSGPPRQAYGQETLYSSYQPSTQDAFYSRNDAMLPSSHSWDDSGEYPDQAYLTSPPVPDPTFTNPYQEQQMAPLQDYTSASTSNTDFTDISQNQDIFSSNSPSPPSSPSEGCEPTQSSNSFPIITLPSNEPNLQSTRKLSRVSNTGSETRDEISCSNCSTNNTSLWRRTHDGFPVCNACGLFMRLHGIPRPLSLKTDIVKRRKRERVSGASTTGKLGARTRVSRHERRCCQFRNTRAGETLLG